MMAMVLTIEDDASIQELYELLLEEMGHEMLCADNAHTGLTLYHQYHPGCVILDWMLRSGTTGEDFLREWHKDEIRRPVLLVCATSAFGMLAQSRYGVPFLTKPFDVGKWEEAVESMLQNRK